MSQQGRRRLAAVILAFTIGSAPFGGLAAAEDAAAERVEAPVVASEAAILIEQRTGEALFVHNEYERLYPASIAKIATAILAIENASPDDIVTVSKEARGEEGTRIYLAEGEQVSMEKLLYGMMLNSGNDAATAIAEHIDGSKEKFAERMNALMEEIGAYGTNFVNPSGLPDPEQYTTASDMAKLARYAMGNSTFRTIVSTRSMPWTGQEWTSKLENHNRMLVDYPGATGIKNGYTVAAGNTLVGSAERDGMSLIGVVLKAPSKEKAYADMAAMLDYGFANYGVKLLFAQGERYAYPSQAADGQEEAGKAEGEQAEGGEWIAREAIWGVYPKDEQPTVKVEADGTVRLESLSRTYTAGKLDALKKEVRVSSFAGAAEKSGLPAAEDKGNGLPLFTIGVGIGLGALALAALLSMRRLRRRQDTCLGDDE